MCHDGAGVTVQATFDDFIAAEIACALLFEGSLRPEEPEAVGLRRWLVQVRGLTPALAHRAEVVLRSARARETQVVSEDADREHCADRLISGPEISRGSDLVAKDSWHLSLSQT
jgi:hypothetical protein